MSLRPFLEYEKPGRPGVWATKAGPGATACMSHPPLQRGTAGRHALGSGRGKAGSWSRSLSILRAGDVKDHQVSTVQMRKTPNGAQRKVLKEANSTGGTTPDPLASGLWPERAISSSLTLAAASWGLSAISLTLGPVTHTERSRPSDEL